MINIAVCEPDNALLDKLETLIEKAGSFLSEQLQSEAYMSGEDFAGGLARGEAYQLVFMDTEMGDMSGIELGRKLRERFGERETLLVYLSGESGIDDQIFDVRPFSFVRVPFDDKEFLRKFFLAAEHLQQAGEFFTVKQGRTVHQIKKRDVICLESVGRDIILSASGREDIQYREALKNEQDKLKTVNFIRPHQSFIVNLDHVEQYRTDCLIMTNKKSVPISELRMRETKQAVLKFWEYRNI